MQRLYNVKERAYDASLGHSFIEEEEESGAGSMPRVTLYCMTIHNLYDYTRHPNDDTTYG